MAGETAYRVLPGAEPRADLEDRLLALIEQHYKTQADAMKAMQGEVKLLRGSVEGMGLRLERMANRMFLITVMALVVAAGSIGAGVYLRLPDGTTVSTGEAAGP